MRQTFLMVLVACLSLAGMPPASAAERKAESEYAQPATGSADAGGGCTSAAPDGCEQMPSGPGEVLMSVEIIDDSGSPVAASVSWDTDGNGVADTGFEFCGKTESPQEIPESTDITVFVWAAPSSACPNGKATSGVVKASYFTAASDGGGAQVLASPRVQLGFSDSTPKRGSTTTAKTGLKVCGDHAGTTIHLQRKKAGVFKNIASKKLDSNCRATFKVVANFKSATFRTVWPKQDDDHRNGKARPVTVTTH